MGKVRFRLKMSKISMSISSRLSCICFCQKYSFCVNVHVWETFTNVHKPTLPSAPSFSASLASFLCPYPRKVHRFLCSVRAPQRHLLAISINFFVHHEQRVKALCVVIGWRPARALKTRMWGLAVRQGYPVTRVAASQAITPPRTRWQHSAWLGVVLLHINCVISSSCMRKPRFA